MSQGKLFVISGPSGVGKDTTTNLALKGCHKTSLSISATTRKARPREIDGVDYYFLSKEMFENEIKKGRMLEWAEYNGNLYGTPKGPIIERLNKSMNVILIIETQGSANIKKMMPEATTIFMAPPSMELLEQRLRGRGTENEEAIQNRLSIAKSEIALAESGAFDVVVVNDDRHACALELACIFEQD